ncbi:diguanylate cyclase (GGDEF)-like protein [Catenuloplanes nepalensis]|uniref:Diguanylate cyclase (GGDEF)-like protein n=1 Tax=Catenuloplanes nepalensis TaxID=587533 RepID=A0ABT9N7R1_9ACTN|nr:diguanylate cyclase [Catenuloplanes nepalensis]MDP9799737.1 diguanylate cyclase (GGDEF)-like protein [Catenuloplanes nepalensis]
MRVLVDEVLYESERTLVTRRAGGVVLKRLLGPGAEERARHERAMLERAAGVPGVPALAEAGDDDILALVDPEGGRTLGAALADGPLPVADALRLATGLAGTLAGLHRRGLLHRDITPANVLLGPDGTPTLIDFGLATAQVDGPDAGRLVGTLGYVAPEQTGRTGRGVDQRADLYGLGATLYAALTGRAPFGGDTPDPDPLRLVHDILVAVPEEPAVLSEDVPIVLSAIVMRLLEKEPDRRYQSAEGLAHDLDRVARRRLTGFTLGERDFPARLVAPPRPAGRAAELAALRTAVTTGVPLVTIGGPPGIGRTSLLAEIRSLAEDAGARFVSGRCDPRRADGDADGLREAFQALGGLLLTEPETVLSATRDRLRAAMGENAELTAAIVPELGLVLGLEPAPAPGPLDSAQVENRLVQVTSAVLRAVASPAYPLVLALDDFHLAPQIAARSIEAVAAADPIPGVTLVVTHRDPVPVLTETAGETLRLRLGGLTLDAVAQLITEVLRAPVADPAGLAAAAHERTGGHPAETLALLNELRATGTLWIGADGWAWDPDGLRRHLGEGDAGERLAARIRALPEPARALLTATACLGGDAAPELLGAACGRPAGAVLDALTPALDDGLAAFAGECVRITHERVRDALRHGAVAARAGIARRLAADPAYRRVAAELLLEAEPLTGADDRALAGPLFAEAADALRILDPERTERFLSAALRVDDGADRNALLLLHAERHATLCRLGRLAEADEEYRYIEINCPDPIGRVPSACVQIGSLNSRARFADALELGSDLLTRIGVPFVRAPAELHALAEAGMLGLAEWAAALPEDGDPRPENQDRAHQARARLVNALLPNALVAGPLIMGWLQTTAHRLWVTDGPAAWLAGPVAASGFGLISARDDYRSGYRIGRHLLAECERRGWERSAAELRFILVSWTGHWHERLEDVLPVGRTAFTGLMRAGVTTQAGLTCSGLAAYVLDSGSLGALDEQVTAALRYARRVGHAQAGLIQGAYRQFVRAMRGETRSPGAFTDDVFDEAAHLATVGGNAPAAHTAHALRGLAALIAGDGEAARASTAAAAALMPRNPGFYLVTTTTLLCVLTGVDLDRAAAWLAARAEDAPGNFSHLASLAEAERARRDGDRWTATVAYDRALREVSGRRRPWHYAVIAERAAEFQLTEGNEYAGDGLLRLARDGYAAWGATAKVRALETAHQWLRGRQVDPGGVLRTGSLDNSDIDLLGVLDATRTLSSETRVHALRERVDEVLRALTGATGVLLVASDTDAGPRSVIRYVQRTRAAVVSEDAVRDDRFARDEYFAGVARCALLALPVVARGEDRAVLILENRSSRNAFTADRLDAVRLVTGQLAVSLENAQLYASLEAKIADRTRELEEANARLEQLAVTDPLTGLTNRRRLDSLLAAEWRRAARPRHPLSVAMIDIDHFKGYNDHYGHQGGDRCLATVAATVAEHVRSTDHVARYGGEEFCIILPETPLADALVVAERVRSAVEALREPHALSPHGIVTVSIGVAAALPHPDRDVDSLVKRADECLYAAKRAGRNRMSTG